MEKFTPKKKGDIESLIEKNLLNGYIIRFDFRDETPLEVMDREFVKELSTMHNIGREIDKVHESIHCSHSLLHDIVKRLSEQYSVRKVWCSYSGCCQYSTYGYYLD